MTSRAELEIDYGDNAIKFTFPEPDPMRFPGALIQATGVSFAYPGRPPSNPNLQDVTLTIHPKSRMAFVGKNGEGKSTLVTTSF